MEFFLLEILNILNSLKWHSKRTTKSNFSSLLQFLLSINNSLFNISIAREHQNILCMRHITVYSLSLCIWTLHVILLVCCRWQVWYGQVVTLTFLQRFLICHVILANTNWFYFCCFLHSFDRRPTHRVLYSRPQQMLRVWLSSFHRHFFHWVLVEACWLSMCWFLN